MTWHEILVLASNPIFGGLALWIIKSWYAKNIEGAIQEARDAAKEAMVAANQAKDVAQAIATHVSKTLLDVGTNQNTLNTTITKELAEMSRMFAHGVEMSNQAMRMASELKKDSEATDQNIRKLASGGISLNDKLKALSSEVHELGAGLLRVQEKKNARD